MQKGGAQTDMNDDKVGTQTRYERLTPLMCARLAAPHTWPGPSVLTTVFGGVFSIAIGYDFDPLIWCALLGVAVFAQSAVNTLNDWADYRAGTDTVENSDDPTDAVLVYNNPNPSHVLALGICYMLIALVLGLLCVAWSQSATALVLGLIGAIFIFAYSNGKIPVSYLPLGEVVSGVVMGGLIPLCDICIFAGHSNPDAGPFGVFAELDWGLDLMAIVPFVIGVALVMATQNISDIERDEPVGRRTLPVLLGRSRSVVVYRVFVVLWIAIVLHLSFWYFNAGFFAAVVTLVLGIGTIRSLLTTKLVHEVRGPSMGAIMKGNLFINGALILAIMVSLML
jgi:1,4-dihydroxy-2-naphthoate octaprenyltransferase